MRDEQYGKRNRCRHFMGACPTRPQQSKRALGDGRAQAHLQTPGSIQIREDGLVSVPNSVKSQLDRAKNLLAQSERADTRGDTSLALEKAREGLRILKAIAAASQSHGTLLVAAQMGYRGTEVEIYERTDRYQVIERKFLGISIGSDVVNVPAITHKVERWRLL